MRVMLLSLPGLEESDGILFPLGIGYLVSSLKSHHEVQAYHFEKINSAKQEVKETLATFRPDVVGITCSTFNRGFVREMIGIIRGVNSDVKIVVGGVHASFCYDQMIKNYDADVVVIGEGEVTFPALCDALENKTPLKFVHGIAYKENGLTLINSPRDVIHNLDDLPLPDYSYAKSLIERSGIGYIITSRGCPVRCTFCSTSSFWGQNVRINSVSRVVDEMEQLISQFKVSKIYFHDDTFNLGITRVKEICAEILKRGIKIEWGCACRVSPVSEEMLAIMVEAGCRHICWGIESGSAEMLRRIEKNISLSQIRNAFELSKKFSTVMSTGAFTMVGNPGESEGTVQETINFLNTIPITDQTNTSILYILPGTLLYEDLKMKGMINDEDWSKHNSVPYYTVENSYRKLVRWAKMVSMSGNRIPFNHNNHFWNSIFNTSGAKPFAASSLLIRIQKVLFKPQHALTFIKRFLPAGRIRF